MSLFNKAGLPCEFFRLRKHRSGKWCVIGLNKRGDRRGCFVLVAGTEIESAFDKIARYRKKAKWFYR